MEIQLDLTAKQKQEKELDGKSTETGKAIAWLNSIDGLKKEISSLAEEAVKLQNDVEAFKPERTKLDRAIKAASLDGSYATLTVIRKQQSDEQAALKALETALPELESSANTQAELLKSAEKQTVKAKEELKTAAPLIKKIRSLDQKLAEQEKAVSEGEESCKNDAAKIESDKQTRLEEQDKRIEAAKDLDLAEDYLKEHAQDEWLISGLAGVEEQLGSLLSRQKEITPKETDHKKADSSLDEAVKKLDECTKQCGNRKHELDDASEKLQQGKSTLSELLGDRMLREYRTEKETMLREMAFLSKIAELEDHRAKLEDGNPCPLCGSKEHPFAEGNVPIPDETEKKIESLTKLITKAEDLEAANKILEETEITASKNLRDSEKMEATAANDKKATEKTLWELKDGLEKLIAGFTELKQAVVSRQNNLDSYPL